MLYSEARSRKPADWAQYILDCRGLLTCSIRLAGYPVGLVVSTMVPGRCVGGISVGGGSLRFPALSLERWVRCFISGINHSGTSVS